MGAHYARIPFISRQAAIVLVVAMMASAADAYSAAHGQESTAQEARSINHGAQGREGSGPDTLADGVQWIDEHGVRLRVTAVKGLERPWALAFLPDGAMLVTERPGRLRRVEADLSLDPKPVSGLPAVLASAYKGLMDIALHPDYSRNRWVYFTYSKLLPGEDEKDWDLLTGPAGTAVLARGRYDGAAALTEVEDLFVARAATSGVSAARIAFDAHGKLYMSIGAPSFTVQQGGTNRIGAADEAQDPRSHAGKVLRLNDDGSVPADNPFVHVAGYLPEIYALGVRNTTGLLAHPATGQIWEVEHGPQGGDELNVVAAGANYGWPLVSYGRAYTGERTGNGSGPWLPGPAAPGIREPLLYWYPNIAPGGMVIYSGKRRQEWRGDVLIGGLASTALHRVDLSADNLPVGQQSFLGSLGQRIREVREGPEGDLYLLTDHDRGALLRVELMDN